MPVEDWTIEKLRYECKRRDLKNYSSYSKAQLYAYCFEGKSHEEVKGMKTVGSGRRGRKPAAARKPAAKKPATRKAPVRSKTPVSKTPKARGELKWTMCTRSESDARVCMTQLSELFPGIVRDFCEPVVPGPAAALIVEGKNIVGVTTPTGEIQALSKPIPAPPPPPPPPPGMPPMPTIPRVQVPKTPAAKAALKEDLAEQKAAGNTVEASDLQAQLQTLKKVTDEERAAFAAANKQDRRPQILKDIEKGKQLRSADEKRRQREIELEERKQAARPQFLKDIERGKKLSDASEKRRQRELELAARQEAERPSILKDIERGKQLRKYTPCDYGMVYDPRLRTCIPVQQEVAQLQVERAIDKTLEKMEKNEDVQYSSKDEGSSNSSVRGTHIVAEESSECVIA
jgi:hypothetical protein